MPDIRLCAESELPPLNKGASFVVDGTSPASASAMYRALLPKGKRRLALFNTADGLIACEDRCPHQESTLAEGTVKGCVVTCKWHYWQFDLASGKCLLSDWANLKVYKARIADGAVFVSIDDV